MKDKVYIILLNWNGWGHTIECLESVFRNDYPSWQVIVCDNGSEDNSLEHIKNWASGELDIVPPTEATLHPLVFPPVNKPISFVELSQKTVEVGGNLESNTNPMILIRIEENLGFAGGNNVALRYALKQDDFGYAWLLNNDTIIQSETLSFMVEKINTRAEYGMCGSTVLYYHAPDTVQARGGNAFISWIGHTRHLGFLENREDHFNESKIESKMNCVLGASMLVSEEFLEKIGLMSEIYFLYFEELDWALRAKSRFELAYASKSIVYHKEGGTIGGGNRDRNNKSSVADYYEIRNRLIIIRKYFPWAIPTACLALTVTIFNRIRRKQWERIGLVFKTIYDAFKADL